MRFSKQFGDAEKEVGVMRVWRQLQMRAGQFCNAKEGFMSESRKLRY